MKSICKFLKKESGYSIVMILAVLGLGVGSLSFVITDILPKLKNEKSKIESTINYRIFIASLNDYILHAIKERWCLNIINGIDETDLLESGTCTFNPITRLPRDMEEIVTNPGNLERLLWGPDNIGSWPANLAQAKTDNRILPINFVRRNNDSNIRPLTYEQVALKDGKLKFKITKDIIKDMNDEHPLFTMTNKVKGCLDSVDIEIFQDMDLNNKPGAEERKIGISLNANLLLDLRCLNIRTVKSTTYYTFYPRRLHTFSLIKYGDLAGDAYNEFYGPVYLAGDFVLPEEKSDPAKNTVFYDTLTFGVFDGVVNTKKEFSVGTILHNDQTSYSFDQRGDPYQSKQNSYKGFRGFLGGIRLDSSQDKGFFNLFDHTNKSNADIGLLRQCIDEAKFETTPSSNNDSQFGVSSEENQDDSPNVSYTLSFTEKNKFKLGITPTPKTESVGSFIVRILAPGINVDSFGTVEISAGGRTFSGLIGKGSQVEIKTDLNLAAEVEKKLKPINDFSLKDYKDLDKNSSFPDSNLGKIFKSAANALGEKCKDEVSAECVALGFDDKKDDDCPDAPTPELHPCNYSADITSYNTAKTNLITPFEDIKVMPTNGPANVILTMEDVTQGTNKVVLNQKKFNIKFSPAWISLHELGEELMFNIKFIANNYSTKSMSINLEVKGVTVTPKEDVLNINPDAMFALVCPQGMGQADWDIDMSVSSNFSWNYANTSAGADIQNNDNESLEEIVFDKDLQEGHRDSMTKSVVKKCTVQPERTHIYGFYVCETLNILPRTEPLYMIGTFIIKNIIQAKNVPVYWYSIWHGVASDLILNDLFKDSQVCHFGSNTPLNKILFKNFLENSTLAGRMTYCGPQGLIQGKNNFSWTTVDPDVGIAKIGDSMTSQKANRIQKWVIKADSKVEVIK
jgi:hypothetical protein